MNSLGWDTPVVLRGPGEGGAAPVDARQGGRRGGRRRRQRPRAEGMERGATAEGIAPRHGSAAAQRGGKGGPASTMAVKTTASYGNAIARASSSASAL